MGVWIFLLSLTAIAGPLPKGLRGATFVAFDTETTGLSAENDRVVEIGAVRMRAGRVIARRIWLINPGRPIPPETTRVHGITDADVAAAPSFKDVYPEFAAFIKGAILVAHNAGFDVRFMAREVRRNALAFPPEPVLDSLKLTRRWYPGLESHTLEAVADHLHVKPGRYHRGADDAETLAKIFIRGLSAMPADTTVSNLLTVAGEPLYIKTAVALDSATAQPAR